MFTGIIESAGTVRKIINRENNLTFSIESEIAGELRTDQSLSHNGVCLTVESADTTHYNVTAIQETLHRSNLGELKTGSIVNLERSLTLQSRLDGHLVQGHVDCCGRCLEIKKAGGSHIFRFEFEPEFANLIVEKGSVTVNGVSLTVFDCLNGSFTVAIIPYTFENTNFHTMRSGSTVNLEFDIIGKYVARRLTNEGQ